MIESVLYSKLKHPDYGSLPNLSSMSEKAQQNGTGQGIILRLCTVYAVVTFLCFIFAIPINDTVYLYCCSDEVEGWCWWWPWGRSSWAPPPPPGSPAVSAPPYLFSQKSFAQGLQNHWLFEINQPCTGSVSWPEPHHFTEARVEMQFNSVLQSRPLFVWLRLRLKLRKFTSYILGKI
jgi:hypothetical protein